ncbi:MAG: hypothetical protein HKN27_00345 [Silicimonas sp.]|nr:hypothetical protein [Silicimonas sp.]
MSYRWGFDLDMAAVRLMRREAGRWREVAVEKIDSHDIEDRLQAMAEQIDEGAPVDVFLPKDQILYTDLDVTSEDNAQAEIERAVEGMTPYTLDEVAIDWEMVGPGKARVAAIARETLDEAFAFAESRGRSVAGYSSLADPVDFPRMPDFGGMDTIDDEDPIAPVPFASSRPRSEPIVLQNAETGAASPVVKVDDATPVMQVEARETVPLDPGAPINPELAAPRVSTDIAASTVSDEVGATLSPRSAPGIRIHRSSGVSTLMVFAVAFLLTVGIAFIVWSVLPLSPGRENPAVSAPVNGALETETHEADVAAIQDEPAPGVIEAPDAEPETEVATLPEPVLPDLPIPELQSEMIGFETQTDTGMGPTPPNKLVATAVSRAAPRLAPVTAMANALPGVGRSAPLPPRPAALADLLITAPPQGPDPREVLDETTNTIYIASIEHSALAFDAIALPDASRFSAEALPAVGETPVPFVEFDPLAQAIERAVIASIEPDAPIEEEPAPLETVPSLAPEAPPVDVAQSETTDPQTLRPTALAATIPERAPRARPGGFVEDIERDQFGGRTRAQLGEIRPGKRPESEQIAALRAATTSPPSALAVATAPPPRSRPRDFDAIVAQAQIQREAARVTASIAFDAPDTSSAVEAALDDSEPEVRPQDTPRLAIPSNASVARQATIENAIRLNRINLVGVYGAPSDRRALVRLSSGRYIKVKVGDRIDGGTVARITDSELLYQKGRRVLSLSLPKG